MFLLFDSNSVRPGFGGAGWRRRDRTGRSCDGRHNHSVGPKESRRCRRHTFVGNVSGGYLKRILPTDLIGSIQEVHKQSQFVSVHSVHTTFFDVLFY